ncbi:hypothetical protein BD309DRAFT_860178 [Dichomitus squalens]|uniref:RING-type domain-containing protein n=1 Tax=Dichomitus squalens TaxID=114155 RepID=A0A4Q9NXH1_9APHY|nr:hypothetical protein BD311DRAFT_672866 [Dichomitus squalens]TBU45447.1 hypothetical protein BD309DRAFT_860178 [Dichomitus squalens]TBU55510.1 hypothetical protein BD310DRAFT_825623 [Dichomitus squalens]
MLVLHPNSRCDVCLEGYYGPRDPIAITCGHILCQWCLQSLPKLQCPLCRHTYNPADARKLHVDKSAVPPCTPAISSHDLDTSQASRLQSSITRVTLEGASRPELEELLQDCHDWLDGQPQDQVRHLNVSSAVGEADVPAVQGSPCGPPPLVPQLPVPG